MLHLVTCMTNNCMSTCTHAHAKPNQYCAAATNTCLSCPLIFVHTVYSLIRLLTSACFDTCSGPFMTYRTCQHHTRMLHAISRLAIHFHEQMQLWCTRTVRYQHMTDTCMCILYFCAGVHHSTLHIYPLNCVFGPME
jgi:hypothetical protein